MMKRNIIIFAIGAVLVLIISAVLYNNYISSPKYSLLQIKKAYDEHDITSFDKYVDTKSIVGGLLDKVYSSIPEQSAPKNEFEKLGSFIGKGIVEMMKPKIEELWIKQIGKLVESGTLKDENTENGLEEFWQRNDTSAFKQIVSIVEDGKIATIGLEFYQPRFDTTMVLNIKMRDKGDYWQLFDLSDFIDYMKLLNSLEQRRVDSLNENSRIEFLEYVSIKILARTQTEGYYFKYFSHEFEVEFLNTGNKIIDEIDCAFEIYDLNGSYSKSAFVAKKVNLQPGEKYVYEGMDSYSNQRISSKGVSLRLNLVNASFNDGSKIAWHETWERID